MRGTDHQTSQMFSDLSPEQMVPQDHPLRVIRPLANAALDRLSPAFSRLYSAKQAAEKPRKILYPGLRPLKSPMRGSTMTSLYPTP